MILSPIWVIFCGYVLCVTVVSLAYLLFTYQTHPWFCVHNIKNCAIHRINRDCIAVCVIFLIKI